MDMKLQVIKRLAFFFLLLPHVAHGVNAPEQLSEGRGLLFQKAMDLCGSVVADEASLSLLDAAAKAFDVPALSEYASMIRDRRLDDENVMWEPLLDTLYSRAVNEFGTESVEMVKCNRVKLFSHWYDDENMVLSLAERNVKTMHTIYSREPHDWKMQELWLLCRLEQLACENYYSSESPHVLAEAYSIEQLTDSLYNIHKEDSETKMFIYLRLAQLKPIYTNYSIFLKSVQSKLCHANSRIPSVVYFSNNWSNAIGYYIEAAEMAERLYGEDDIRTLYVRLECESFKSSNNLGNVEETYLKIKDIKTRASLLLNPDDMFLHEASLAMWECCIWTKTRLEETAGYKEILKKVKQSLGEHSRRYVDILYSVIYQRQRVNLEQAAELLDEMYQASRSVNTSTPSYQCMIYALASDIMVNRKNRTAFETYFSTLRLMIDNALLSNLLDEGGNSWMLVMAIRRLAYLCYTVYDLEGAATYMKKLIELESRLADHSPLVIMNDLLDYSTILTAVERFQEAIETCNKAKNIMKDNGLSAAPVFQYLYGVYGMMNDSLSYRSVLQEAIQSTEEEQDWNIYYKLQYASLLYGDANLEEYERIMQETYPKYLLRVGDLTGTFLEGCFTCCDYLLNHNRIQEALDILTMGFERFKETDNQYNLMYRDFVDRMVFIYKEALNDYTAAEGFLNEVVQAMVSDPSNSNHELTLQFVWMYYDLLGKKGADLSKKSYIFQCLLNEFSKVISMDLDEKSLRKFRITWGIPLISLLVSDIFPIVSDGMKELEKKENFGYVTPEAINAALSKLNELVKVLDNFEELLLTLEEDFQTEYPDYLSRDDYADLLRMFSSYYWIVKKDAVQAENWLLKGLASSSEKVVRGTYFELSVLYRETGRYVQALEYCDKLESLSAKLQNVIEGTDVKKWLIDHKSFCYYKLGDYEKAAALTLESYQLNRELLKTNIDLLTEFEREEYLNAKGGVGNLNMNALLAYCPEYLAPHAYDATLMQKGYLLRASERTKRAIMQSDNASLKTAMDSLLMLKKQYGSMSLSTMDMQTLMVSFSDEVWDVHRKMSQLEREINEEVRRMGVADADAVHWQDVQHGLGENDVAIEYVFGDSILGALVLKKSLLEPKYVRLGDYRKMSEWFEHNAHLTAKQRAEALYERSELDLYALLWEPLRPYLNASGCIFYSPSGILNSLSMGALRCPDGKCMMDHYTMSQLTTTASLVTGMNKKKPIHTVALFGAAYYSEEQVYDDKNFENVPSHRSAIEDSFSYLPYTKNEVISIAQMFSDMGVDCKHFVGSGCTEAELRSLDGNSPDVLHFATHGFFVETETEVMQNTFLSQFPNVRMSGMMRAGLAFAGANSTWEEGNANTANDGILTASEVSAMNLDGTRLAVLSACETGVGIYTGEGVYGMYRGFKQAGVDSILASLWKVNDLATALFVKTFYYRWFHGDTMQQAYASSVAEVRKQFPNPYYWAPFVLIDAVE